MNTEIIEEIEKTEETKKTIASSMIVKYAQSTQTVCLYLCIAIFLIILFVLSPLNTFFFTGFFSKVIILFLEIKYGTTTHESHYFNATLP